MDESNRLLMFRVHQVIHFPGIGQMGPEINESSDKVAGIGALKLYKQTDGVLMVSKTWQGFIPNGNIICMKFFKKTE